MKTETAKDFLDRARPLPKTASVIPLPEMEALVQEVADGCAKKKRQRERELLERSRRMARLLAGD